MDATASGTRRGAGLSGRPAGHGGRRVCPRTFRRGCRGPRPARRSDPLRSSRRRGSRGGEAAQASHRLRPVQGLDLRLLIHREHQRSLGRVGVQAHDVVDLLHEQRVGRQLEGVRQMRLELEPPPDPVHGRLRRTTVLRHRCPRPVGGVLRQLFQRGDHQRFHLIDAEGRRLARPADPGRPRRPAAPPAPHTPAQSAPAGPGPGPMSPDVSTAPTRSARDQTAARVPASRLDEELTHQQQKSRNYWRSTTGSGH